VLRKIIGRGEPRGDLRVVEHAEQRVADRGARRRKTVADARGEPEGRAPLVAGEVEHFGAVEDRDLHELVAQQRRVETQPVELAHLVERRDVGAAELDGSAPEHETAVATLDQAVLLEHDAQVRGRRFGGADGPRDVAQGEWPPVGVGEQPEDLDRPGHGRGRVAFSRFFVGGRHRPLVS